MLSLDIPFPIVEGNEKKFDTYSKESFKIYKNRDNDMEQFMIENKKVDCNGKLYTEENLLRIKSDHLREFSNGKVLIEKSFTKNGIKYVIYGGLRNGRYYSGNLYLCKNGDYIWLKYFNNDTLSSDNGNFEKIIESINFLK
jgi:hypothetical protein